MNLQTLALFPTAVVQGNLGRDITTKEMSVIDYHSERTVFNEGNLTSKEYYVLDKHEELKEIRQYIQNCINYYVETILSPSTNINFYITQSWLNYTGEGEWHHKHTHPNSILSGVFYFKADSFVDKINFFSGQQHKFIDFNVKKWNIYNSSSWWVETAAGDILIFPSDLCHSVDPKLGKPVRVSLAFNTFAKGTFGTEETLRALYL